MINKNRLKGLRKYKQTIKLNQVQKEVSPSGTLIGTPFGLPAGDPRLWYPLVY